MIGAAQTLAWSSKHSSRALTSVSSKNGRMDAWEYLIVALPQFEPPTAAPEPSAAVQMLNAEGADGWEAIGMTVLANGGVAVLLKRPRER